MFTAAKDVEAGADAEQEAPSALASPLEDGSASQKHTSGEVLQALRQRIIKAMSLRLGVQLIAHKRALHRSADGKARVACAVSKPYAGRSYYWYAYHPAWEDFLKNAETAAS